MTTWVAPDLSTRAARLAGRSSAMAAAALNVLMEAKALAARHVRTGGYISSFNVTTVPGKNGVTDRLVTNHDPAAVSIEFGHITTTGRRVGGQRIMGRAAR